MMTLDLILFGLRLVSGGLLLVFLGALFVVLWRDYHSTSTQAQISRRVYGQLIELTEVDGMYTPAGKTYPLLPLTTIGRSPTNTLVVDDTFASSEHASITLRNGQWWLEDRNSRNGTLLNEEPVTVSVIVTEDDLISIGTHHFRLHLDV
jgi:hypothetical protein